MINIYKKEIRVLGAILALKLLILLLLPLTGDEAYFIKWADNLSMGYYDHPPMVGWVIYLMSFVTNSHLFFRLFAVATTFVAAFVIYKIALLYGVEEKKALLSSFIFLASPADLLLILMTNDVALLFFSSLGTLFLLYSLEKKEWLRYAFLAGIFLGSAFLSKYFAVFLMLSLLLFSIALYKTRALKTVLVVSAIVSLFIAQNLYFNYNSCWNNILFNFFVRTNGNSYNIGSVLGYFGLILYILTPWGAYYLFKTEFEKRTLFKLLFSILSIVFFIFLIVSLKNHIGLHWFLIFVPYLFLLFSYLKSEKQLKLFRYNAYFTFAHAAIFIVALALPTSLLKEHKKYSDIVMYTQPEALCSELEKFNDERIFTNSYSAAALLSHYCQRDVTVLFNNSKYGRFDDKLFDVRTIAGKEITLFHKREINSKELQNVCSSFELNSFEVDGATFYSAKCVGFDYDEYKKSYLDFQNENFYNIPSWLPVGACYFKERYYQ
ncbi:MAG: glycosyltransferase family 39 protein [Sulfurimonas sp.]|uniref:ArnT family glycosyltransferase n=1 Tax=Sulfurimonas sp. TaxID=2022749 RepID=UPI0028CEA2ED|nr:glycosyltransferase family 39 protein [Sulfurimonas sp.]MDT8337601.1 glycosyltransferase family 39 protein [Sulfurimonas sp.]